MSNDQKNDDQWIDDILDDIDDPIVSEVGSFNYLGFVESLILGSLNTEEQKQIMLNGIDTMRQSEMSKLVSELKENQNHKDCREQFREMCKRGVFN
tara:strand:- start:2369 stop:2656 length:288 start_codon:yes stop_codon:yes gene_type:complete